MPKSRGRKRKPSKTASVKDNPRSSGLSDHFRFARMDVPSDTVREALRSEAMSRAARVPEILNDLKDVFRTRNPELVLACASAWGLARVVDSRGSTSEEEHAVNQTHIEVLQAIMLSVPLRASTDEFSFAGINGLVGEVLDKLVLLSDGFVSAEITSTQQTDDIQRQIERSFFVRMKFHTHGVRNWGYFGDVVNISRATYAPIDEHLVSFYGFSANDLITVAQCMCNAHERMLSALFTRMAIIRSLKRPQDMLNSYFRYFSGSHDSAPEEWLEILNSGATLEQVRDFITDHMSEMFIRSITFPVDLLSSETGVPESRIVPMLDALSMTPGDLSDVSLADMFIENPIWSAPVVKVEGRYLVPMPQAIFSHIHSIMHRLTTNAELVTHANRARANFLETRLVDVLTAAFPGAQIVPSAKWIGGGQNWENDCVVLVDRTLLIVEAKAHHLSPKGLKGVPVRVKKHVQQLIVDPSEQSARLERHLLDAQCGSETAVESFANMGLTDVSRIDSVIRLSVSLENLSALCSLDNELHAAGWIPAGHELAPMMVITDLQVVVDILENPIVILHYLAARTRFQRRHQLMGDELDFLGLYLESRFHLDEVEEGIRFALHGTSLSIDRYYVSKDTGGNVTKPRINLGQYLSSVLDLLAHRRPDRWTDIGFMILDSAHPDEVPRLDAYLSRARSEVASVDSRCQSSAEPHRYVAVSLKKILFYVHREADDAVIYEGVRRAVSEYFTSDDSIDECVAIVRHVDSWDDPYQKICIATR